MNPRSQIEKALRSGLLRISGKGSDEAYSLDEAVSLLMGYLDIVLDLDGPSSTDRKLKVELSREEVPIPRREAHSSSAPPAVPIEDLLPITGEKIPVSNRVRSYHTTEEMQVEIFSHAPLSIEVTPEGWTEPLTLNRVVTNVAGNSPGYILGYVPRGADQEVAFSKRSFWTTEEDLAVVAKIEQIKAEAIQMYRKRTGPIRTQAPIPPQSLFGPANGDSA